MENMIELHDSRISDVEDFDSKVAIIFSSAYLYSKNKGWSQKARLNIENGIIIISPSEYPVTISDGEIKVGAIIYENLLQLPFSKHGKCEIEFSFSNGEKLKISGNNPELELFGEKEFIEIIEQP